ncbi:TetR/AcrR family transcriptional regulator [Pseudochryseolinea flava]|uniref:TetR/AcrR family transcriptional regulator n=1 Tax=Pseudochryseolinea flava TaxID=2059302 RepID=A0A364Y0F6_9BACT|nr:TetR/AcrR family transcriptional regulator [Pseudochryseolinea flava]RAW00071.1 TetR/AcrR family transcriptional regulator [Pseudochryseolinea flava]
MRTRDENKEETIRQKAIELFVKHGFDGLSMQKLAKEAGVSPATLYIYYKDRDDMIVQLWVWVMKKMVDTTLEGFDPGMSFEAGLKLQWQNRARFCMEYPMELHFMEQIKYSPYHEACSKKMDAKFINTMGEFVHNAIRRKEVVKVPVEVYWSVAFAPLYQLVKMHMSGRGLRDEKFVLDEKTINQTFKLVLKALKP